MTLLPVLFKHLLCVRDIAYVVAGFLHNACYFLFVWSTVVLQNCCLSNFVVTRDVFSMLLPRCYETGGFSRKFDFVDCVV